MLQEKDWAGLISGVREGPQPLILNEWNGFVVMETQWLQTALGLGGVKTPNGSVIT